MLSFLLSRGCEQKSEYEAVREKLEDTTKQLTEAKESLKKSQDQLSDLQAHRYQTFTNGERTWRLDSVKGSSCILLTSDQDWKNGKTKTQSCACEDLVRDYENVKTPERDHLLDKTAQRLGCY